MLREMHEGMLSVYSNAGPTPTDAVLLLHISCCLFGAKRSETSEQRTLLDAPRLVQSG